MARGLVLVLAAAALAAGVIAANFALLGAAVSRNDPVGHLSPRAAVLVHPPRSPVSQPAGEPDD